MQINCDLGECLTPDPDAQIMPLIDMANIACGGHAGDVNSMRKTIKLAKQHGVMIGAHPSYADQENFGRVRLNISQTALFDSLQQQLKSFMALCETLDAKPQYIKPHGALYHDMMHKPEVLALICDVIKSINPALKLIVQAGLNTEVMAKTSADKQVQFLYEAFADRGYRANNMAEMIPRKEPGALLASADAILAQLDYFVIQQTFTVDTICFHSDHAPSVQALMQRKNS